MKTYHALLQADPEVTMPVAAIEALIQLLAHSPPSTISETLTALAHHTAVLKRAVRNPIPLSAGTDLFQRYLIYTLQNSSSTLPSGQRRNKNGRSGGGAGGGGGGRGGGGDDFKAIRALLMTNVRLFVKRAKEARGKIAGVARRFIRDGSTVLTSGSSRVVGAVLMAAVEEGVRFRVIYVRSSSSSSVFADTARQNHRQQSQSKRGKENSATPNSLARDLRARGVPVAEIGEGAVAFAMGKVDTVLVGAEGVVENGGVINRLGTYQLSLLARSAGKPFYVVVESHKFVRLYPLGQYDLPIEQKVLDFVTGEDGDEGSGRTLEMGEEQGGGEPSAEKRDWLGSEQDEAVDFTPPELITALITESGVHTPSAVSEELIKIWY